MEINRNQYFMLGIVLVLLGFQFRQVDYYVLTAPASQFLNERLPKPVATSVSSQPQQQGLFTQAAPTPLPSAKKTVRPPDWLAWVLLSVGGVLILHSLAMKRPG